MSSLKFFYCFNLRLLLLTVIGFALSNSVYSQFQVNAKYSENEPKPSKVSSAKIRLDDETQTPHTLVGGFYTTRNGFESKLLMNNKGPQPIEVSPTLYGETGGILQMPPITVERNSFIIINLSDWANFGGEGFQQGNIRLFHRGKDLILGTQIQIANENKSLIFESKLSELGKFDSRHFEGVWWIPDNKTDSTVILTNTGDEFLTVTAALTRKPHNVGATRTINLLPHQTKVLDVREDFPQGNVFAKSGVLGLSLTHDGEAEDALLAWTMVKDEAKGYSNVATFINPTTAKSNQYHGAGLQLGSVGNDELEPIIILRNTTNVKIDVNVKVPYTNEDGTSGTVSINTIKLNSQEVSQVNMQKVKNLKNVKTAGIEIEYTGNPGSLIASAQSVSKSGNQVFRTLLWDPPALKSAASLYPFSIEGTSSTKAFIKNAGFKDENYVSHITWENGGEYVIPVKTIKKGETVEIDVKKIRDEQIPDERGRTIPLNISKGQIHWLLRRSDSTKETAFANRVPLVGQALQVDTAKGISYSYFCLSCCEYAYSFATLVPNNAQTQHPNDFQYQILEDGVDCYGNGIYSRNITNLGYNWTSTNTNAATVNSNGYATTQGGGQTQVKVKVNLPIYYEWGTDCGGGGGPYFAGIKDSGEKCNEDVRPARVKDTQAVTFSKIAFKKEFKRNSLLFAEECSCLTLNDTKNLTADLKVYQVIIKRDGQPITSSNNTVIVGQKMNLTAEVLPSGTSVSNLSWTLPPTVVKDFVVSSGNTTGGPVAVDGLNTASVSFAWVDGGGANPEDSVAKTVQFTADISGGQISGSATFNVKRPVVTATTNVSTTNLLIGTNSYELRFGDSNNDGITFNRTISYPTNYTGATQWVQIANKTKRKVVFNGNTELDENPPVSLDGCYPYTNIGSPDAYDSPFIKFEGTLGSLDTLTMNTDDDFTMWLMFKPLAADPIWVPIKKVDWFWNAQATYNNGNWSFSGNSPQTAPAFEDTTSFPIWSNVVPHRNTSCP